MSCNHRRPPSVSRLLPILTPALVVVMACGGDSPSPADTQDADATSPNDTQDASPSDSQDARVDVADVRPEDGDATVNLDPALPEGASTWRGRLEVEDIPFLADLSIVNTHGDLAATLAFDDDPAAPSGIEPAVFTLTGTHEPRSGLLALAPDDWTTPPSIPFELLGFEGAYDPVARTLAGVALDYASGPNNTQAAGPGSFSLLTGDGAPTTSGDRARGLDAGAHTFFGSLQCTGPSRQVRGTLDYDGEGALVGTVTVGGPGVDQPLGTFSFSGVHNPDTGAITMTPRLWNAAAGTEPLTFFVDGAFDPATGRFDGDMRTNTNACPDDTWRVELDL